MPDSQDLLGGEELHGISVPLELIPSKPTPQAVSEEAVAGYKVYSPERQRDHVRLVVTCGLLAILGYLVVFATIESASYPVHWAQTKEMLQIILPALTGIIGTVIGFYFGAAVAGKGQDSTEL